MTAFDEVLAPTILEICTSVLALEVTELPGDVPEGTAAYAGCVHLTTEPLGTVVFECDEAMGRLMASRMFGTSDEALRDADVCDAIGELANMAAGNLKAALPRPVRLSLPTVTTGVDLQTFLPQSTRVARSQFASGPHRFSVSVFEREIAPGG